MRSWPVNEASVLQQSYAFLHSGRLYWLTGHQLNLQVAVQSCSSSRSHRVPNPDNMADLAHLLLRTVVRAFYTTDHILVIDALIQHSTLPDHDLAFVLAMQSKALRKLCGRLKEDGLLSVQTRAERKTDGTQSFYGGTNNPRVTHKDWYYLNFHRAIDSIKYRMYRLNKHVESLGAPTTEKKDLACPRCKAQYTELEVMDRIDIGTGEFMCRRCGHALNPVEEDERANENETMKRLNSQLEKILRLMQQIDATTVPENDFQTALSKQRPVIRTEANPGQQRTEVVDLPNKNLQSTKGLEIKPEKIAVEVQDDETIKKENEASDAQARREKEARQNALPDWIVKSTVSGDITAAGAKEERLRREREANGTLVKAEDDGEEKKPAKDGGEEDVMAAYWEELAKAQAEEAAQNRASDEEEDDDEEDEFEDVDVGGSSTPVVNGAAANGVKASSSVSGSNTPVVESSNATDDEREVKRVKMEEPAVATAAAGVADASSSKMPNGIEKVNGGAAEATPTASDEDEDDEEVEFEDV